MSDTMTLSACVSPAGWSASNKMGDVIRLVVHDGIDALKNELFLIDGKPNGKQYALVLAEIDDNGQVVEVKAKPTNKPFGKEAAILRREIAGYASTLHTHEFLACFGTDADYQEWCRKQPCAKTGHTNDIEFAHVRRSNTSGTGFKAKYSGIPLTSEIHRQQHNQGEETTFGSKDWMPRKLDDYLSAWVASHFGQPSLGYVDPKHMCEHLQGLNKIFVLPVAYRLFSKK